MSTSAPPRDDSSGTAIATSARTSRIGAGDPTDAWNGWAAAGGRERPQPLDRVGAFGHDTSDRDRVRDAFERQRAAVLIADAVDPAREVRDLS